jgi:hypothetical protein
LREAQRATVLQLPAQAKAQSEEQAGAEARERVSSVI